MRERNQQINFRATKSEKASIHRKAKRCGLADSEYIRNCALDKPVAEMPREGLQIACRKLSSLIQYLEQFDDESSKKEAAWLRSVKEILLDLYHGKEVEDNGGDEDMADQG